MIVRQHSIHGLPAFVRAIFRTAEQSGLVRANLLEVLAGAMQIKCVQCGLLIDGGELQALSALSDRQVNAKLIRLLQGYCARKGCDSYHYQLILSDRPDIDWPKLIALAECYSNGPDARVESDVERTSDPKIGWNTYRLWASWASLGLAGILLLLLMRQMYLGGTIPFLREPEHFQVDVFERD